MGYVYCLVRFGVLFLISICFIYSVQSVRFLGKKQINIVLLMPFYVLSGAGESAMFNIVSNVAMLYLFCFDDQIKTTHRSRESAHDKLGTMYSSKFR